MKAGPGPSVPRHLLVAICASLHLVDLLVLGADVAEDLRFRGSRGGQASDWPRCAPCFAVPRQCAGVPGGTGRRCRPPPADGLDVRCRRRGATADPYTLHYPPSPDAPSAQRSSVHTRCARSAATLDGTERRARLDSASSLAGNRDPAARFDVRVDRQGLAKGAGTVGTAPSPEERLALRRSHAKPDPFIGAEAAADERQPTAGHDELRLKRQAWLCAARSAQRAPNRCRRSRRLRH